MGGVILLLILIVITIGWLHRRRIRSLRSDLDENTRQIAEYKTKITQKQERISNKLLMGAKLFNRIAEKHPLAEANASDLQCLVDYYAQLRPKRWQEWVRQYDDLSTAQYVFLILQDDLHYDDDTIATILNIKRTSVRTMRFRIKEKAK